MKLSPQERRIYRALKTRPHSKRELENLDDGWINSAQKRMSDMKAKGVPIGKQWVKVSPKRYTGSSRYYDYYIEEN